MAGQCELPLVDGAARLGITPEALRKRLQRGSLDGCKRDGEWYVWLDEQQDTRQDGGRPAGQTEGRVVVTPALIEDALERTGARYMADLDTLFTRVSRLYEDQLAAKDALIDELRRRAEQAEQERAALSAQLAAGRQDAVSSRLDTQPEVSPRPPWWRRWWAHVL